jgi:hypothetical protein
MKDDDGETSLSQILSSRLSSDFERLSSDFKKIWKLSLRKAT